MKLSPAILDDLKHARDILTSDVSPNWHAGAAGMLRNIAADIEREAQVEKNNIEYAAAKKAAELSHP
jgi:hypothetical protein